jgi:hypothetical protein
MNRIALIGAKEGWCPQFAQATYRRWLPKGRDPSGKVELTDALREIGQDSDTILALAASEDVKAELNAQTNAAKELGISSSPTFVTPMKSSGEMTGLQMRSNGIFGKIANSRNHRTFMKPRPPIAKRTIENCPRQEATANSGTKSTLWN